jgi:bifunctional enzyme CysN/CysC
MLIVQPAWHPIKASMRLKEGQTACVIWLTGISGAGKSTTATALDARLRAEGYQAYVLDGDNLRRGLSKDLGFSAADRVENIRRTAEVAMLMVDAGLIVIVALISPFRADRRQARNLFEAGRFHEIFVATPLAVAEQRDPKGLYKKARRGELKNFTAIDSPYEEPEHPDLRIDTSITSLADAVELIIGKRWHVLDES